MAIPTVGIMLRLPPELHLRIVEQAALEGTSVNAWIRTLLEHATPALADKPARAKKEKV